MLGDVLLRSDGSILPRGRSCSVTGLEVAGLASAWAHSGAGSGPPCGVLACSSRAPRILYLARDLQGLDRSPAVIVDALTTVSLAPDRGVDDAEDKTAPPGIRSIRDRARPARNESPA